MEVHDAMSPSEPAMFMEDGQEETTRSFLPNGGVVGGGNHLIQAVSDNEIEQQQRDRIVQSRLSILGEHILNDVSDNGELYASDPASDLSRQYTDASASSSVWQQQQQQEQEEEEQHLQQHEQQNDGEKKQPPTPGAVTVTARDPSNGQYARKDRQVTKISSKVDPITLSSAVEDMKGRDEHDKQRLTDTRMAIVQDHVLNGSAAGTLNFAESEQHKKEEISTTHFPGAVHVSDSVSKDEKSAYSRMGTLAKGDGYYKDKGAMSKAASRQQRQQQEEEHNGEDRIVRARMSILGEHVLIDGSESGGSDPVPEDRGYYGNADGRNEASVDDDIHFAQSLSFKNARANESADELSKREAATLSQLPPYRSTDNDNQKAGDDGKLQEDKRTEQPIMFGGEAAVSLSSDFVVPETKPPQESALPYKDKEDVEHGTERVEELITAKPVDEEDFEVKLEKEMEDRIKNQTVMALAVAEEPDEVEVEAPKAWWHHYRLPLICLIIVLGGVALALGLTIGGGSGQPEESQASSPSNPPTPAPTFSDEAFLREILSLATSEEVLRDPSTPQHQALQWLLNEDPAGLPIRDTNPERLLERYILVVLYGVTGGAYWVDNSDFLSDKSVCEWSGVFCGNENSIVNLDFRKCLSSNFYDA